MTTATSTTRTVNSPRPGAYVINHYYYERPEGDGVAHRKGGPAHTGVYPDVRCPLIIVWCDHGRQHRLDGPAATTSDGGICWTINGDNVTHLRRNSGDGS